MQNFHFSWYLTTFAENRGTMYMENKSINPLSFSETFSGKEISKHAEQVTHILCLAGNISFTLHHTRYNISARDYVILTNGILVSAISQSEDCRVIVMSFVESFVTMNATRSNYGIVGYLSLLRNPVMKLSEEEFEKCRDDLMRLWERLGNREHLFREEMLGALLKAHILDLYDIHARANRETTAVARLATLMRKFIGRLLNGDYASNRSLRHYANALCITPHYLSELSKAVSGQPATYWIDHFMVKAILHLLMQPYLSLEEIADRLNFSSVSYLSRYVKNKIGITPSEYRESVRHR